MTKAATNQIARMQTVISSSPPTPRLLPKVGRQFARPHLGSWKTAVGIAVVAGVWVLTSTLSPEAQATLTVFAAAIWLWVFGTLNDTYVALGAASALVLANALSAEEFFAALGDDTTWLLIGAFILSAAVTQSGLALRATAWLTRRVSTPHGLVHLLALAVTATAFAVPATSGRAALILPVLVALRGVLPTPQQWLVKVLALVLPTVVLFTAAASLIGAGAHLITVQILGTNDLPEISFTRWIVLGLPYALVMAHVSAEVVLRMFSTSAQRAEKVQLTTADFGDSVTGPLSSEQQRSIAILGAAVALWFSESLHGIDPALVAVLAALLICSPQMGTVDFKDTIRQVPWNLLLFMAATIAMSGALLSSGAADVLATAILGSTNPMVFVALVIIVSSAAHLVIQSRSARSAVLIPLVVATAPAMGVNPVAVAFISTVAAGFCHTLPSSAKPLAIFSVHEPAPFSNRELMRVAAVLFPIHLLVMTLFAWLIWPALGLNLYL